MTKTHDAYDELDLGEVLREIFHWKWAILGITILVGAGSAFYSMSKPNVYESEAALIVREPQRVLGGDAISESTSEAAMLTVETLQTLSESTAVTRALFDKLLEDGTITGNGGNREALYRGFQTRLSTALKRPDVNGGLATGSMPVLQLRARAASPETARIIADEWAYLVESKSAALYSEGMTALDNFVGSMYSKSGEDLRQLESELASKKLEASLALKEARLKTTAAKITELEDAILDNDVDIAVNEASIAEGQARVAGQQADGEWIGTVAESLLMAGEAYPFTVEDQTEPAQKILELTELKVRQMKALRTFHAEQNLLEKETRFAHSKLDLERILAEKAKVEDELPAVESAIAALSGKLESIPETITLDKAITDDALWNLHVSGTGPESGSLPPLKTEMLNPVYNSTRQAILELTSRAETLRGSTTQLAASEAEVMAQAEQLENEIDVIMQELETRQAAVEATKTSLAFFRDDYAKELSAIEELRLKNARTAAERANRAEVLGRLSQEVAALEQSISDFKLEIEALTREADKTRNVRTALASTAEEVALLQVSTENATRTGTTILYNAQENPEKVAPARGKMVVTAMLTTVLLCSVVVVVAKLLRESEAPA